MNYSRAMPQQKQTLLRYGCMFAGAHKCTSRALDLINNGDSLHDGAARNENWWGFGEPVRAVTDGEIVEAVDGIADNAPQNLPPVTLNNIAGNLRDLADFADPVRDVRTLAEWQPQGEVARQGSPRNGARTLRKRRKHHGRASALAGHGSELGIAIAGDAFVFPSFTYLGPGAGYEIGKHVAVSWKNSIPPRDAVIECEAMVN